MQEQFDNPFWRFSLDVYAQPGIAAECLALQGAFEIDVNLLLLVGWISEAQQAALQKNDLEELSGAISSWHSDVVRPLRRVRSAIKASWPSEPFPAFRSRVKQVELQAEQIEQALLFDRVRKLGIDKRVPGGPQVIRSNLRLWQGHATSGAENGFPEALARLLEARSAAGAQGGR